VKEVPVNRKIIIGIVAAILIVVVLACVFGGRAIQQAALTRTPTVSADESDTEPQPITAKGVVVPVRWVSLAFESNGVISDVPVKEGDAVKAGDLLATMDAAGLELAVSQAEVALESAQAQLAAELATPEPIKVAAAQAVVSSTQVAYWDALARYNNRDAQKVIDDAEVENARKALEGVQWQYDAMAADPLTRGLVEHSAIADRLEEAKNAYDVAVARARLNAGGTGAAALRQAAADLARARSDLYALEHPTTPENVAIRQAEVHKAELALKQARLDLANARLIAPFDGMVAEVNVRSGELASPGEVAIVLADLSQLTVETEDLDEWGAAHIKIGQDVKIVINALDDAELSGTVTAIAPKSVKLPTGDTAYTVTIALKSSDHRLRWGMTVKAILPRE
jgi:HlyD family secretion protein